eukprot:COSAG02_NODE_4089_length_5802_cov_1.765737_3_plen_61_part_00
MCKSLGLLYVILLLLYIESQDVVEIPVFRQPGSPTAMTHHPTYAERVSGNAGSTISPAHR